MQPPRERLPRFLSDATYRCTFDEGRVLYADEGLVDMLGLDCTPADLYGRRLDDLRTTTEPQSNARARLHEYRELRGHECHFITAKGDSRWVLEDAILAEDPESGGLVVDVAVRDITEHKQAEQALRESEGLLRATLGATADGLLVVGEDGKVIHANPRFTEMWRIPAELLAAGDDRQLLDCVVEQLREPEAFVAKVRELYGSQAESFDVLTFKDGRVFERYSRPLVRAGHMIGRVWSFRDTTARHRAETQSRLDEARLEALAQLNEMTEASLAEITDFAMEAGVALTGSTIGYLAFMNEDETVLTMHAWSRTAMAECAITDKPVVYPIETTGLWGEAVRQRCPVVTNDYAAPSTAKKGYPEGHVHVQRHMNIPVFEGDRIVAVAGVGNKAERYGEADVMQLRLLMDGMWRLIHRQRAAEALRRAHDELERRVEERTEQLARSNAELEQFAYVASHDLQEPLRKIVAFGDRLASTSGDALGERGRDYVARMQSAARRMQGLIDDLLTFSRVTTRALPFERVDLNDVVHEVLEDLATRLETIHGRVDVGELPTIDADRSQMRQLLQNLIVNGLKFRREGHPPVVRVTGRLVDETGSGLGAPGTGPVCEVVVEDNGIGFDPQYAERIFGMFQRLHTRSEYEGTGVGLTICRKIVQRHQGRIAAEGARGRGAKFTVTLPADQSGAGGAP